MVFRTACFFPAEVRKTKNRLHAARSGCVYTSTSTTVITVHTLTHTLTLTHSHALSGVQRKRRFGVPVWPLPLFVCLFVYLSLSCPLCSGAMATVPRTLSVTYRRHGNPLPRGLMEEAERRRRGRGLK